MMLLPIGPLQADTFPVTKTDDTNDGTCDVDCSLREAIKAANANPGADDVSVPAGNYLLALGQLTVTGDASITGAGQTNTIIDGNAASRVFELRIDSTGVVEFSGVTIQGGYTANASGGGIYSGFGHLVLTNSTVSENSAHFGGGISNLGGDLTLTNSTVSGNAAETGGGIANHENDYGSSGTFTLTNVIVADNSAPYGGNCSGGTSLGYNLTDDDSCGFTEYGDLVVADAMLGPLQDNGGPTETHALLPSSPAIDAGDDCPPPDTDQRGVPRPQGAGCDIGAFELEIEGISVDIDIRPGSDSNPIYPSGRGNLPVAILGSDTFEVAGVDVTTLAFGPDEAAPSHDLTIAGTFEDHLRDVNDDGLTDLISHYRIEDTGIEPDGEEACITGKMLSGTPFEGCDVIRAVPKRRGSRR